MRSAALGNYARADGFTESSGLGQDRITPAGREQTAPIGSAAWVSQRQTWGAKYFRQRMIDSREPPSEEAAARTLIGPWIDGVLVYVDPPDFVIYRDAKAEHS